MSPPLEYLDVQGKKTYIIATTVILAIISHVTTGLRIWAKLSTAGKLQREDWLVIGALGFSYGSLACQFYGLTVGLGEHEVNVSKSDLVKLNISIWVIQRMQPPCLLCLKLSIIFLYMRLFSTPNFKKVCYGIITYTCLWTIAALGASTFECIPVNFFWDKTIPGGHCVPNALRTISFTNGVTSFAGDLFIFCMPLPMIWKLQMNKRRKIALGGIFTVGAFVIITSIIRFVALLSIDTTDLTFTQVDAGIWTYMEIGIGIACANLPLLRPLFKRFFDRGDTLKASSYGAGYNYGSNNARSRNANISALGTQNTYRSDGFERMIDKNGANIDVESLGGSGSEVELQQRRYKGEGIKVETNVQLQVEDAESQTGNSRTRTTTDVRGPKSPGF